MPATKCNIPALEAWIKEHFKESAFNQCRRQPWPITTGKPMRIHTKPDTKPYWCKKPTLVPMHYRQQVKANLESDVKKGILERVPDGEPDTWCSRMVIQPKKSGKARRTVDLSYLANMELRNLTTPGAPPRLPSRCLPTSTSPPWTVRTVTMGSSSPRWIGTRQPLIQSGASTGTEENPRVTSHLGKLWQVHGHHPGGLSILH